MIDCSRCTNRARINGLSQETYCNSCIHYENEAEALYCDIFGFCGCGDLDSVLCFILKCLGSSSDEYDKIICPEKIKELVLKHPLEVTEFILHFFDSKNLTEHGGSVYASSLTDLGLQAVKVGETWQGI